MHLPVGKPVIVDVMSKDVIHDFCIPNMRSAQDAIPGSVIPMWFMPIKEGTYDIVCAQLCGSNHSAMRGELVVESEAKYKKWFADSYNAIHPKTPMSPFVHLGPAALGFVRAGPGRELLSKLGRRASGRRRQSKSHCASRYSALGKFLSYVALLDRADAGHHLRASAGRRLRPAWARARSGHCSAQNGTSSCSPIFASSWPALLPSSVAARSTRTDR